MKTPTQCALWTTPQLSNDPGFFEIVETFEDNCNLLRISHPTEKDHARIEKYRRAIRTIRALEKAEPA